jgi:hypothetical protein
LIFKKKAKFFRRKIGENRSKLVIMTLTPGYVRSENCNYLHVYICTSSLGVIQS